MTHENRFRLTTVGEVKRQRLADAKPQAHPSLDASNVPEALRELIPLAERWGVSDDTLREQLLTSAPKEKLLEVLHRVSAKSTFLSDWLAGPEAHSGRPSKEYIAFAALQMFVDDLRSSLD